MDISHFRCSWPVIYFARTFLVSNEIKFKKRRILQEDESRPVERKTTFDARVPFHRSSHEWSRAIYPGVQVTLCICGERRGPNSPPVFAFRGEPMIYIIDSSSNSTNSRLGRPCLCVLCHAVLPINRVCDRLCSCRISMFRVKDSRTESGDFLRPPRATELVRYREWRVTMSRKIEKEKKISKIDLM